MKKGWLIVISLVIVITMVGVMGCAVSIGEQEQTPARQEQVAAIMLPCWSVRLAPLYHFPGWFHYEPFGDIRYLKVEFRLTETVFSRGDKMLVEPRLVNTGNRPVTLHHSNPLFRVVLEDEERELKWTPHTATLAILVMGEIGPGDAYSFFTVQFVLQERENSPYVLKPGIYTLHVYADFEADGKAFRVHASPIQIEIDDRCLPLPAEDPQPAMPSPPL